MMRRSVSDRLLSFWPLQTGGWLLYTFAVVTTNAPLWHHHDLLTFRFTAVLCGFIESFLLYAICGTLWRKKLGLVRSLLVCAFTSAGFSLLPAHWTALVAS